MIGVIPNVLSQSVIDETEALYRECSNTVKINTDEIDRHWPSSIGHFMLSEFTGSEFADVWQQVFPALQQHIGKDIQYVYGRILKYAQGCHIPRHLDSYDNNIQRENDLSVLVGLNDPGEYRGGVLIIDDQRYILSPGDLIYYTYEHYHEVQPIQKGVRRVINLRCKLVK